MPDQQTVEVVVSPCIGICKLNAQQVCVGCGRTLQEIGAWLRADNEQRRSIVAAARVRRGTVAGEPASR
jgi:predicted Fe-S protein YdhL (DUF1289 family)